MKGQFLVGSAKTFVEGNIYADKSSVILDWLLHLKADHETFSIREVSRECSVSVGLVQRVFEQLVFYGLLETFGLRTAKRFHLKKPSLLLTSWIQHYNLVKKAKLRTYKTGLKDREEVLKTLGASPLKKSVLLSLHAAAEAYGVKNNNLQTLEFYVLDPTLRPAIEKLLVLEPQERGYEVLLIEPYYKTLLHVAVDRHQGEKIAIAPVLLTFLDLYHFPLRGIEQAEFMAQRLPELKILYHKKG